jgi:hypothetical protein
MLGWMLIAATMAAPSGWKVTDDDSDGCELSLGPAEADGYVPMRAECYWPEGSLDKFKQIMSDWEFHDDIFDSVVHSQIKRKEGDKSVVWQEHQASGISNREVMIEMWHEVADGYDRYAWKTLPNEPLTPKDGNVRTIRSDGYWQAKADPKGGIRVVHVLSYNPGGSVPGFIVRWFQTSGLATNASEVRAALKG